MSLTGIIIMALCITSLSAQSMFNVSILDNPYPGYLNFDWLHSSSFAKLDNYGNLVGTENPSRASNFFRPLKNGNFAQYAGNVYLIYDKNMNLIDSVKNTTNYDLDFHDFIQLENGNYLMLMTYWVEKDLSQIVEGGRTDAMIMHNALVEVKNNGQVVWTWDGAQKYDILDVTSDIDLTQKMIDFTHINSMHEDANGNILVSVRHLDELSLIDKSTGNFIWRMGGSKSKKNQFTFLNDALEGFYGFSHQHTATILPNGNILLYDNGNMKSPQYSRVVEYSINSSAKTVSKVWEYRTSPDIFSHAMGSVDRLPNGNTLICWSRGKITEVRMDKTIALEITFPSNYPVYRACKSFSNLKFTNQNIQNTGTYSFDADGNQTGVTLVVSNLTGKGNTYVQYHNYPPHSGKYSDTIFSEILPHRWVLSYDNPFQMSGTIIIKLSNLGNIQEPSKIVIYKRDKEGSGTFSRLTTTYNQSTNEITAPFMGWGEFVLAYVDLKKPTLIAPANDTYVKVSGTMQWSQINGANWYQIHISQNQTFPNNEITSHSANTPAYNYSGLEYNKKYFWRVRAINDKDSSDWSSVFSFNTAIKTPTILFPKDKEIAVKLKDSIKWTESPSATDYHLQVSYSYDFANPVYNARNYKKTEYPLANLVNNVSYYLRVRAFRNSDSSSWSDIISFRTNIATPVIESPLNNQINIDDIHKFTWSYVSGAEHYKLQISTDGDFTQGVIEFTQLQSNELVVENLNLNSEYYCRALAYNKVEESDWSETFVFYTALEPPVLVSPNNQAKNVAVNPLLTWNLLGTGLFRVQVAEDANFNYIAFDSTRIDNKECRTEELRPNTTYFWRVKSIIGEKESKWSSSRMMQTGPAGSLMAAPRLLTPAKNSDNGSKVHFVWSKREYAINYRFQLSENKEFTSFIRNVSGLIFTEQEVENLQANKTYYWRVKAYSKYDSTVWSEVWPLHVMPPDHKVKLVSPSNDQLQVLINGRLEWNSVSDAQFYNVQLSYNEAFTELIEDRTVYEHTYYHYTNLLKNTRYYWRVRYTRHGETSQWSDIWSFRSSSDEVLESPQISSPADNSIGIPISGKITWDIIKDADEYDVIISLSNDFSNNVVRYLNVKGNSLDYNSLSYDKIYYIRISAHSKQASSLWSNVIKVTTELETPLITKPSDNSKDLDKLVEFEWSITNDYYKYDLQICESLNFDENLKGVSNLEQLFLKYELEEGKTYFARVLSHNDTNTSKWSKPVKFTIYKEAVSVSDDIKNGFSIYPNPAESYIKFENHSDDIGLLVIIYDSNGNQAISHNLTESSTIDISKLTGGVYFVSYGGKYIKFIKK